MAYKSFLFSMLILFLLSACQPANIPVEIETGNTPAKGPTIEPSTTKETDPPTTEPSAVPVGSQAADPVLSEDSLRTYPLDQDIIQEIAVFGGAGGGSPRCAGVEGIEPALSEAPEKATELLQYVSFDVCNLKPDEEVTLLVEKPNGETVEFRNTAFSFPDGPTLTDFSYLPMPDDPPGSYKFSVSGLDWSLEFLHRIESPGIAHVYYYDDRFYFLGFAPNEIVKLLAYKRVEEQPVEERGNYLSVSRLYGWTEYQMDGSGSFQVDLGEDLRALTYAALGEISGAVNTASPGPGVIYDPFTVFCAGAPSPVGIRPGGQAEVLTDKVPIYSIEISPDSSSFQYIRDEGASLAKGTVVGITSNAQCVDGKYIWGVSCGTSFFCNYFVPEAGPEGPYLRPIGVLSSTGTQEPQAIPACPGTKPSRLQVGMNAEVTTSGAAPQLSLRSQPSMNAEKVHVIAAGRGMMILDGPVCADDSYWWYIRSEQGFVGWSREGDNEDYWIDPLP